MPEVRGAQATSDAGPERHEPTPFGLGLGLGLGLGSGGDTNLPPFA